MPLAPRITYIRGVKPRGRTPSHNARNYCESTLAKRICDENLSQWDLRQRYMNIHCQGGVLVTVTADGKLEWAAAGGQSSKYSSISVIAN